MDLEGIIGVIILLLHWRVALCLAGSAIAAYLAVQFFSWLTGLQGIALAFLGLPLGVAWEDWATQRPVVSAPPDSKTTSAVAGAAAGIAGATWGVFSVTSVPSLAVGMVVMAAAAWWWVWYAATVHHWVSRQRARLCFGIAAVAYPLGALVGHQVLWHSLPANAVAVR